MNRAYGQGRVFRRGKQFWIAYCAPKDGRVIEIREPGGPTEKGAEKLLRERLREVANHRTGLKRFGGPRQERVTVGELLDELTRYYEVNRPKSLRTAKAAMK